MPLLDELRLDPAALAWPVLLALLLLVLAALAARLPGEIDRPGGLIERWRRQLAGMSGRPLPMALLLIAGALVYSFLGSGIGPTVESVAAFLGILAGLVIGGLVFQLPLVLVHRSVANDRGRLSVLPAAIVIAVVLVLLSRATGFEPGFMYGVAAIWVFDSIHPRDEARAQALSGGWMLLLAMAAWLALPLAETGLAAAPLLQMTVGASLATILVGGLQALLLDLVPLPFLRGSLVYAWNRAVWVLLFLAAAFLFAVILANPAGGGATMAFALMLALSVLALFALVARLLWVRSRRRGAQAASSS